MSNYQIREHEKKCLYSFDSGVVELNVHCRIPESTRGSSWVPLTDRSTNEPLYDGTIYCALHPELSINNGLLWDLYQVLARQGCAFTIFPSVAAFELYMNRAKETGGEFKEGNWDVRDGESRIWRDVKSNAVDPDTKSGYWVTTHVVDCFTLPYINFV
ncbi:hypothetical protein PEX1_105580 [Penicillium expansum]|nr:hypothetical protein PEXP_047760 [Penicillium expansum]KGO45584.1 hypothetical protein PEX1_105580 [Penicillium expansum]